MLDKKQVKAAAAGRWEAIFNQLAPQLIPAMKCSPRHAPECPMPGHQVRGKDHGKGKFRLPADYREEGKAICTCGHWSDGFALLMALNGWSFAETVQKVGIALGLSEDRVEILSTDETQIMKAEGKFLCAGMKRVPYRGKTISVYALRIKPREGRSVVLSGLMLKKAVAAAGVKPGDNLLVEQTGIETCRTAKGTFKRKLFAVRRLPSDEEVAQAKAQAEAKTVECRRKIEALWHRGVPLDSSSTEAESVREYFAARHLETLPDTCKGDLRAVATMACRDKAGNLVRFNGLVAAVRDLSGRLVCVHRTFLCEGKKAPIETPKMLMAIGPDDSIAGCAIHLGEPEKVLCVAEGIETAASVVIGTGYPCWSCVSANGLRAVQIPEKVKMIFIFEDKDRSLTGQKAATELRARLEREGKIAVVCSIGDDIPEGSHGLDWNDMLCRPDGVLTFPVHRPQ